MNLWQRIRAALRLPADGLRLPAYRLHVRHQRRLVVLALSGAGSLVLLLSAIRPTYPSVPDVWPTLDYLASPTARDLGVGWPTTPVPRGGWSLTPYPGAPWYGPGTPTLGELPGATSTPTAYLAFLPSVYMDDHSWAYNLDVQPEPPAMQPAPEWPVGLDRQTNSKLSLHVIRNSDPFIMEFIRRTRPRVIKAVDDLGWLFDAKGASPNTITIGRPNGQDESVVETVDPAAAADAYINHYLNLYRLNNSVDFWEGWNEFHPGTPSRMRWYAAFEARRACAMQSLGLHAAIGGFSMGTPEFDQMALFLPALKAAYDCGAIFTLHEYNSPTLECGTTAGHAGIIPGAPYLGEMPMGAFSLRYRFWYEGYLKPRGLGDLPLVISELGIESRPGDQRACGDPGPGRAWKSYVPWWTSQGFGPSGADAYVNLLAWYDAQIRQDPYVLGATIFTAGALDGNDGWNVFDLHDVIVPLAYYAVGQ